MTLSSKPPTSKYPDCPSRTQTGPSLRPKPVASSSAFASAATTASSPGSDRVMLNGLDAGAGPSPRIDGAGVPVWAEIDAVTSARRRATGNRVQRVIMAGFYTGDGALGETRSAGVNYGLPGSLSNKRKNDHVATYETGIRQDVGRACRSAGAHGTLATGSGAGARHGEPARREGHRVRQERSQGPHARCLSTASGRDLEAHGHRAPLRGRLLRRQQECRLHHQ